MRLLDKRDYLIVEAHHRTLSALLVKVEEAPYHDKQHRLFCHAIALSIILAWLHISPGIRSRPVTHSILGLGHSPVLDLQCANDLVTYEIRRMMQSNVCL